MPLKLSAKNLVVAAKRNDVTIRSLDLQFLSDSSPPESYAKILLDNCDWQADKRRHFKLALNNTLLRRLVPDLSVETIIRHILRLDNPVYPKLHKLMVTFNADEIVVDFDTSKTLILETRTIHNGKFYYLDLGALYFINHILCTITNTLCARKTDIQDTATTIFTTFILDAMQCATVIHLGLDMMAHNERDLTDENGVEIAAFLERHNATCEALLPSKRPAPVNEEGVEPAAKTFRLA